MWRERIHTDHGANTFLDTKPSHSRRQARWQEFLSRFHFTEKFLPHVRNNVADPLLGGPLLLSLLLHAGNI